MNQIKHEIFDAIIIGVGQSGSPLALALAEKDYKVALVERNKVGGSCINYGCTPSKTMMASAKVAEVVRLAGDYGIEANISKIHLNKIVERKEKIVNQFRKGILNGIEKEDFIELIRGEAKFSSEKSIKVDVEAGKSRFIKAEKIFINTGSRPDIPEIKGLSSIDYLDSTSIMELKSIPEHLLILGGSYIGLEFGQMFKRFGSKITVIEHGDQLVSREDQDIAEELQKILEEEGMDIYLNASVIKIEKVENTINLEATSGNETKSFSGSHILIATGVKPNTEVLNLDAAGIETDEKGNIRVNEYLETNKKHIYAMGDVKGGPAFTHISYDDFRVLKASLFGDRSRKTKGRMVPYTMFTNPELARVGLNEKDAQQQERRIKIARMPMSSVARAIEKGETKGLMKVIIDQKTDHILGATILGVEGGELLAVLQVAMMGDLPYTTLRDGIFSHPTLAESLNNLFMNVEEVE